MNSNTDLALNNGFTLQTVFNIVTKNIFEDQLMDNTCTRWRVWSH
jgi:hypothetical protein